MHRALVAREMCRGVLSLPVHAELIPGAGGRLSTPWTLVTDIAPEPRGVGLAGLRAGLHLDRGIIGKHGRARARQLADVIGQRLQQRCRSPDPICERRPVQVELFAGVDFRLAI